MNEQQDMHLHNLQKEVIIERIGPAKDGHWEVVE